MKLTPQVKRILENYEADNAATKNNLTRLLMHGKLGGTGKLLILPVDQGMEHGPARSFAANPAAYDPHYHYQMAIDAGLSAYAAPLGALECGAFTYGSQIPTILKLNNANSLNDVKNQAITGSVKEALRLGCIGIGYTIYPGSDYCYEQMDILQNLIQEAKDAGLLAVVWSYPRGGPFLDKAGETAVDICAYAAHIAAQMGAHIIKVKPPSDHLCLGAAKKVYEDQKIDISTLAKRTEHIMQSAFAGRRLVLFSGGEQTSEETLFNTFQGLNDGGASGAIIGRNTFQRKREDALAMLDKIINIFKS
ncbi:MULTISPECIES: class I fructose-bisphosphate aldolase [Commensalibacter]|uniref:fructose-bisphosphate aldolase n=2 Tax=Commensalibacter TaxID=1079922 RepID=W7E0I6_9PROT|nr:MULTISPECIES: class I fructose-bisphosphate aldolase [Commensalibacter]EUK18494.1 fructose-bisphosphate aldolase [Commensalibacter papalotli (ex Servin-Garciduenas et al. 2014)]CAI3932795.1 DhnA family (FbaB) (PDB:1OJX) [Commensalibacter papalotli (ex Botero et al. 2024)]CAI3942872.1 DhnA family (FbaB) (PDB:1OJX) [Commensalibacter papalotli (ex Botero et al. 2024)]